MQNKTKLHISKWLLLAAFLIYLIEWFVNNVYLRILGGLLLFVSIHLRISIMLNSDPKIETPTGTDDPAL